MPNKELYLYSQIYRFVAESLISQMEENKASDITVRMDTNGGDPQAAYGIMAKIRERRDAGKKTNVKVDGRAYSAGSFLIPFFDSASALNTSSFIVHRAGYPDWYEKDGMTEAEKTELIDINKDLRKALEAKVNPVTFAGITGKTFDEVFSMDQRIDVRLNAQQAKAVGFIDEVYDITESKIAAQVSGSISDFSYDYFDLKEGKKKPEIDANKDQNKNPLNNNVMTLEEFKAKHPELYAQVYKAGVTAESDRTGAWMAFSGVDAEAVKKGIKEGRVMSQTEMAEMSLKAVNQTALAAVGKDSPGAVTTEEGKEGEKVKTEKEKNINAFVDESLKNFGVKEKIS